MDGSLPPPAPLSDSSLLGRVLSRPCSCLVSPSFFPSPSHPLHARAAFHSVAIAMAVYGLLGFLGDRSDRSRSSPSKGKARHRPSQPQFPTTSKRTQQPRGASFPKHTSLCCLTAVQAVQHSAAMAMNASIRAVKSAICMHAAYRSKQLWS
uniref:Uncharacterized protein n=1 Tax=Zea mays TaxID=4577 RepID=C4J2W2_MAIZE|nr:unknown [Zea mays]